MKHLTAVSRKPELALSLGGTGRNLDLVEQLIILGLSLFFSDWQNYQQVISNLQKYYSKTPSD